MRHGKTQKAASVKAVQQNVACSCFSLGVSHCYRVLTVASLDGAIEFGVNPAIPSIMCQGMIMQGYRCFAVFVFAFMASPTLVQAQAQIRSGALVYTSAVDFVTGFTPNGTGYFVSQAFIPSPPQPSVNQPYYVSVTMAGIVSPAVGRLMGVHFIPPAGTSVVVNSSIPVRCFYGPMNGQVARVEFTNSVLTDNSFNANLRIFGCPQPAAGGAPYQIVQLPNNNGTAYFFDRRDPQRPGQTTWPIGSQASYEFQIPVVSNRTMDGFSTPDRFFAPVQSIQGDGVDPWAYPFLALLVSPSVSGNVADMESGLFGAPPPPPPNSAGVTVDCRNLGPNAAQNATCGFTNIPSGLNARVVCNVTTPVASLAVNSFIRCSLVTDRFVGTRAVNGVSGSATVDSNLTNNIQALTLNGGLVDLIFASRFE
jgi:hypothetical protein